MAGLPEGTLTLLFTDVDGSTELVKRLGERYEEVLADHRALLRAAFAANRGLEVDTQGDSFFVAFRRAADSVRAAVAAQRALATHPWPGSTTVRVRMGLHTGEPHAGEHGYTGLAVHRAARICTIANGGQVLLSAATAGIVADDEIPGVAQRDLGEHRLKDFDVPGRIFQLVVDGLPSDFPPLRGVDSQAQLTGTVTIVMVEGRRTMRLANTLPPERFGALLSDFQQLLARVLADRGGQDVEVWWDSAVAAFASPVQAARAAVAASTAVAEHPWQDGLRLQVSIGLHSGEAGVGWIGLGATRCAQLCDAAEGGEVFASETTARLLQDAEPPDVVVRDLGERPTRRTGEVVRAFQLVSS